MNSRCFRLISNKAIEFQSVSFHGVVFFFLRLCGFMIKICFFLLTINNLQGDIPGEGSKLVIVNHIVI